MMDPKEEPTPFDQKLFLVFITTFASMTVFEFLGQFLYPLPPDWRAGLVRIFFVSGLAVIIAYFPLRSFYDTNERVLREVERSRIAEKALRESESRLGSIIRVAPIGIAVESGRIIRTVNDRFCTITGYTAEELTGASARLLYPTQEEFEAVGKESRARIAEGKSGEAEARWQKKDGTLIDVLISSTRVDPQDRSSGIAFTVLDITERKRAEAEVRESERKFRTVVENSLDGILIVALDGAVLFRNRSEAKIFDIDEETALPGTSNVFRFVAPESRAQVIHDFDKAAQGIDSYPVTYQAITATGRRIWVEAIGKKIQFQNAPALLVSLRDITSRRQLEEAVRRANRQLELLSTITRHDINNKLQALDGYIELLHMKSPDPLLAEYFSRITEACSQIAAMIRFTKEFKDIGGEASAAWQNLRALAGEAEKSATPGQVSVHNELPADIEIFADPLIVKVFFNLIDNALRHGGKITELRFSFHADDRAGIIVCEDDGEGVVPGEKDRIFDLGFGKNMGFGLAISREILDITGMKIRETGEPGKGARFEITVPKEAYRAGDNQKPPAGHD
ncbi:MAG TPA: PAS domain-containing sensor histidine kinase [Methanoregula sp.]|nr:PAS domain-containing sensor histidine kinase [Methanoregula sp.]